MKVKASDRKKWGLTFPVFSFQCQVERDVEENGTASMNSCFH